MSQKIVMTSRYQQGEHLHFGKCSLPLAGGNYVEIINISMLGFTNNGKGRYSDVLKILTKNRSLNDCS